jgi:hypothetical protein
MDKNIITILIISLVAAFVWIGITVYTSNSKVTINPNASSYTNLITPTFDNVTIEAIQLRIAKNLPIKTEVYKNLKLPEEKKVAVQTPVSTTEAVVDTVVDTNTSGNTNTTDVAQ